MVVEMVKERRRKETSRAVSQLARRGFPLHQPGGHPGSGQHRQAGRGAADVPAWPRLGRPRPLCGYFRRGHCMGSSKEETGEDGGDTATLGGPCASFNRPACSSSARCSCWHFFQRLQSFEQPSRSSTETSTASTERGSSRLRCSTFLQ